MVLNNIENFKLGFLFKVEQSRLQMPDVMNSSKLYAWRKFDKQSILPSIFLNIHVKIQGLMALLDFP